MINFTGEQVHTISSKMLTVAVLFRVVDLCGVSVAEGDAVEICLVFVGEENKDWPGKADDGGVEAVMFVVQDEDNKGVCAEAVLVQGLEVGSGD